MDWHQGKEIALDCKNLVIHGKLWGKRGGPPLLALHGWLDNAASFDFLGPLLQRHHVLAIDLPGHGQSGHYPVGFSYHLVDCVQIVMDIAAQLKWQQFSLLGHSLGGAIATLVAGSYPDKIHDLYLLDAIGPLTEDIAVTPVRLAKAVDSMLQYQTKQPTAYPDMETAIQVRQKSGNLSQEAAAALAQRGVGKITDGYLWRFDRKLLLPSALYLTESQTHAFLSAITAKTILFVAKKGLLAQANKKLLKKRKGCIKKLKTIQLAGGHHVHMEHPETIADMINQ